MNNSISYTINQRYGNPLILLLLYLKNLDFTFFFSRKKSFLCEFMTKIFGQKRGFREKFRSVFERAEDGLSISIFDFLTKIDFFSEGWGGGA